MQKIPAFLLTREWRDTASGVELVFWARSEKGPLQLVYPGQSAVCFIDRSVEVEYPGMTRRPVDLLSPDGDPVDALYFRNNQSLQAFLSPARVPRKHLYETDIRAADRYLMERFVTGPISIAAEEDSTTSRVRYLNPKIRPSEYRPSLSVLSIDIETNYETNELYSIGLFGEQLERVLMITPPCGAKDAHASFITHTSDERELLLTFFKVLREADPDILIGWNVIGFDLSVLEQRCRRNGLTFSIGRNNGRAHVITAQSANQLDIARVPGRVVMDGIESLRAAFYNFENFSLEAVADELLGRGKLIKESAHAHRGEEIRRQYLEEPLQFARYNLEDCKLVREIFDHTGLIEFAVERAAATGLSLGRVGGSVAAFDFLYLPRLHRRGFVAKDPPLDEAGGLSSPGGYVLDSSPGLYDNVLVLDFKSLYPSIIRTFLIDPLALWVKDDDRVDGFQGASFSRNHPILPDIIEELWSRRDSAKQHNNNALSQAVKIIMNSFYGVLGTSACRFFDTRLTSSITRRGHEIIRRSQRFIEEAGLNVIYGDTDSLFVWLKDCKTEQQAIETGHHLAESLNRWWTEVIENEHGVKSRLEIEFETHYLKFLMPTVRGSGAGSKKRYAGMVRKRKGGTEMVFKGLETVRTDWTPLAREFQHELFRRVFNNEPVEELVRTTHQDLYLGKLDDKIIYRKQIRQDLDKYVKNIPPHVQAAKKLPRAGRWVEYIITTGGPEPIIDGQPLDRTLSPDYDHYSERQLKPVADTILVFIKTSFDDIVGGQLELFST